MDPLFQEFLLVFIGIALTALTTIALWTVWQVRRPLTPDDRTWLQGQVTETQARYEAQRAAEITALRGELSRTQRDLERNNTYLAEMAQWGDRTLGFYRLVLNRQRATERGIKTLAGGDIVLASLPDAPLADPLPPPLPPWLLKDAR